MPHSTFIREDSSLSRWELNRDPQYTNNGKLWSTPKWDVSIKHVFSRMDLYEKGSRKTRGDEGLHRNSLFQTEPDWFETGLLYMWPHRHHNNIYKTCTGPRQSKLSTEKGSANKTPPLNKKLLVIDPFWQKKNQFSPVGCHWVYEPFILGQAAVRSMQNKPIWRKRLLFHFCLFWHFFTLLDFCVAFFVCLLRKKETERQRSERWGMEREKERQRDRTGSCAGGIWEELREEKIGSKCIVQKN